MSTYGSATYGSSTYGSDATSGAGRLVVTAPSGTGGPGGNGRYIFQLLPTEEGGRGYSLATRPWQPGDFEQAFRKALHPFDGGLAADRLRPAPRSYSKGNADASNDGMLLHPPKLNPVTLTNGDDPFKFVAFNSLIFIVGGRYMYYFNPATNTVTQDKDFGSGKEAVDAAVFNNELIVAMGETEKIYKRTTSGTWTQASDNTYAIALGTVDSVLWRAESTNKLSKCSSTPLTLANWNPASPNQYTVGDTTWPVHTIIDYGGIPWVMKGDGAYAPDPKTRFINQAPQLSRYPNGTNGKGAFVAQASLWVPSASGLLRLRPGSSKVRGPENTFRPGYRFWVRGGVEWGNAIYLLVDDEAGEANSAIIKMVPNDKGIYPAGEYLYHEWAQLDGTLVGKAITVTSVSTNPELVVSYGNNLRYLKLGRGGGRDIDDANYAFGDDMSLETGRVQPSPDLSVVSIPTAVEVTHKLASNATLSISGSVDGNPYVPLLTTREGGGTAPITSTTDYQTSTRYFPVNTSGQFVEVKFEGEASAMVGANRSEILEAYLVGYLRPRMTDEITLTISGSNARSMGIGQGLSRAEVERLWRDWGDSAETLLIELQDYERFRNTRFLVLGVKARESMATVGEGSDPSLESVVEVRLIRVDYANAYAEAA